jgi:hypothetical protein
MSATEKQPCPKCGEGNYATDRRCLSCGALLIAPQAPPPPSAQIPAGPAVLPPPPPPPAGSGFDRLIPSGNPQALAAYYIGLFAFIPFAGLLLGVVALVLGIKGLLSARSDPGVHGTTHAWVGIICGGFWALAHLVLFFMIGYSLWSQG